MMTIRAITVLLLTMSAPCFAQGSRTSFSVVRQYLVADQVAAYVPIPDNLQVNRAYRPLLEDMLEHSLTFRRQCLRLAGNPLVNVRLNPSGPVWTRGVRAITHFVREASGGLNADITLARGQEEVELIAHEIEHVIEQLDHIDLASLAELHGTGVRLMPYAEPTFETTRAEQTGLRVAREVRDARKGD
jgi:hypothetical protein